ncbi:MAG: VCBS repeat-containing protein [Planctomycetaceae bacterium]
MKLICRVFCLLVSIAVVTESCCGQTAANSELLPLTYNDPELIVDLGVGLWAWPMPMDYDNDGDLDLVVSCPDKPFNGTYFFENSTGRVKLPVFEPPVRIGPGHHNIRASFVDGRVDVMTPATVFQDFPHHRFEDPLEMKLPAKIVNASKIRANQWHRTDWDADGDHDLLIGVGIWDDYGWDDAWDSSGTWKNGPLHGFVFLVTNTGTDAAPVWSEPAKVEAGGKPIDVYGWPSPCLADFDGDGDRDLICGEFLDRFTWFENTATDNAPEFAAGTRVKSTDGSDLRMDLQMIVPTPIDWDSDGDNDLIVGDEDGRVAFVENVTPSGAEPVFEGPVYFQQKADRLKFGALATPFAVDWDGDGDTDILCGNTAGYIGYFQNLGGSPVRWAAPRLLAADGATIRIQAGPNGSIQGPCEAKWGYTTITAADWDMDGRTDIVANSIWGKVVWYRNTGQDAEGLPTLAAAQPVTVEWQVDPPKPEWTWWDPADGELVTQWRTTPIAVDWNRDGATDLVMLDQQGFLSFFERRRDDKDLYQLLPPRRIFVDKTGQPLQLNANRAGGSGRRKLHVVDWDGDGDFDLLANSENADLYENLGTDDSGRVTLHNTGTVDVRKLAGHTSSPATIDLNGNGIPDLLVGAEDGFLYHQSR